jgi:hypothetical protein
MRQKHLMVVIWRLVSVFLWGLSLRPVLHIDVQRGVSKNVEDGHKAVSRVARPQGIKGRALRAQVNL